VDTTVLLAIVMGFLLIAILVRGVIIARRKRSEDLRQRFGPEYERHVAETGDRTAAETELREREQRRDKLDIRELRPEERDRFQESWSSIQRDFVDNPSRALNDADGLINGIMRTRGYPVEDFDRRAEDISVDHPDVVRQYREARGVRNDSADDSGGGSVDTERQRHALTAYRSLVAALLGRDATSPSQAVHPDDPRGGQPRPTQERNR
jgi:hypothetical protein